MSAPSPPTVDYKRKIKLGFKLMAPVYDGFDLAFRLEPGYDWEVLLAHGGWRLDVAEVYFCSKLMRASKATEKGLR